MVGELMGEDQMKILVQFSLAAYELMEKRKEELDNSLSFFRLLFCYREMRWITDSIDQNAYHQAIRELRFVLESMIQAYYVDKNHLGSSIQCKLEIVKEIECFYGGKLIGRTDLTQKNDLNKLYTELCAYVHSSYKELVSSMPRNSKDIASLKFEVDHEMTKVCWDFVNRTIDAIFFIMLSLFPQILGPETKFKKTRDSFPDSMRNLGLRLTLTKWKDI
jgi:hypothetical protein